MRASEVAVLRPRFRPPYDCARCDGRTAPYSPSASSRRRFLPKQCLICRLLMTAVSLKVLVGEHANENVRAGGQLRLGGNREQQGNGL